MEKFEMKEVSVSSIRRQYAGSNIEDDLLLIDDFGKIPNPEQPRKIDGIVLGMCQSGQVSFQIDTEQHIIKANEAVIISDGQVLTGHQATPDFKGILIIMSNDFFQEVLKDVHDLSSLFLFSRQRPVFPLEAEELISLKNYFRAIKMKVDDYEQPFRKDVVRSLMTAMTYDVCNVISRMQHDDHALQRNEIFFIRYIELVKQNFRSERHVSWYAKQLGITAKYLSEVIKKASRRTPNEWIDYYTVLEIRGMLKNTTLSIREISNILNFSNQSFMGKFFKDHVGMSPSQYRRK